MKKILGLDLGSSSIGWAFVHEAENNDERSEIISTGVRIVPLSSDEEKEFNQGQKNSTNALRTSKRGVRRRLQRYKQRRKALSELLTKEGFVPQDCTYCEKGNGSTFESYALRAKAATEAIAKEDLARVFLMINKKRGYKSNRKAKSPEEGQIIDGMAIAKELFEKNNTPGQWVYQNLLEGKKYIPDFYRSDLINEMERIVKFQHSFYPNIFNEELFEKIKGKTKNDVYAFFTKNSGIELAENKGSREETRLQYYKWRDQALKQQLTEQQSAYILTEITNEINKSSGYLGEISDRSKELFFNRQTVGQYLYAQLEKKPNASLKNKVFYRQDYLDEFEQIWETQSKFHKELTTKLKREVRDVIIFYQRRLKSQKHLVGFCEFEKHHKTVPKSSPLFQESRMYNPHFKS